MLSIYIVLKTYIYSKTAEKRTDIRTDIRTAISEQIRENRPNISERSVHTYTATLFNLLKKIKVKLTDINQFTEHADELLKYLITARAPRNQLTALLVLTNDQRYKDALDAASLSTYK